MAVVLVTGATEIALWWSGRTRTSTQIKRTQVGLAIAGLHKGKAAGVHGDTRKALRADQRQHKLPVTGRLSDDVLAKLTTV
jgi:hypothetical protein